jgi:hypothetical protein
MTNGDKIILDLCGGSGSWSKPYKDAGYDVRVITLPKYSVEDIEFYDDYLVFISDDGKSDIKVNYKDVWGILSAPPCTMFSIVRTTPKRPRDFGEGMKIVEDCFLVIWKCRITGNLHFWAMENPRGYLQQFIGRPYFEFDPTEFGDKHNKRTQLWGYFNKPVTTHKFTKSKSMAISNDYFQELPKDYIRDPNMRLDAIKRSITPQGFALAFYKANL